MLQWHRKQTEKWQKKFNVDAYGLVLDIFYEGFDFGFISNVVLYLTPYASTPLTQ